MSSQNKRRPKEGWRQLDFNTTFCVPNAKCAAFLFFFVFITTTILTCVILAYTYQITEKFSEILEFPSSAPSTDTIYIEKTISGPVYLYIEYLNFYQNHRIYLKSKSKLQLARESDSTLSTSCEPLVNYGDLGINFNLSDAVEEITPCGLLPASFYSMRLSLTNLTGNVEINENDISWPTDNDSKYKDSEGQYLNITDEHFKVWMRTGATRNFRKLYGNIEKDLEKGYYEINVELNNGNWLGYEPDIKVILSTTTRIGGKNHVLGWVFLFISILSCFWTVFFLLESRKLDAE